ncbi:hypothetical protein TNCV_2818381 [Trichonephila clavipes]|nr:hypothetical protein TNCV_2818381 [Trichonephila clavipes]
MSALVLFRLPLVQKETRFVVFLGVLHSKQNDFAASKSSDHDIVGDETESNSSNPHTLVVENRHRNSPEGPELMANGEFGASKKIVCDFKPLPKTTQCEKKEKAKKLS